MKINAMKQITLSMGAILVLSLSGCNGDGDSGSSSTYFLLTEGQPPIANAGPDQTKIQGDSLTLDGSGSSDSDGEIISYLWSTAGLTESGEIVVVDTSSLPLGAHDVVLTVKDNDGNIASDTAIITIKAADAVNQAPIARINQDINNSIYDCMEMNATELNITIDGSGSTDDGLIQPLSYQWTGVNIGNNNSDNTLTIENNTSSIATFDIGTEICNDEGNINCLYNQNGCKLTFTLEVNDGEFSDEDNVTISVMSPPPPV